jgi:hypothetical protein
MHMRVFRTAAMIALLAGPAYAQAPEAPMPRYGDVNKADKTQTQIEADRQAEKAYNNSLGNIPDKGPSDPWGNARSVNEPKPVAKPAAKKTAKTGSAKPQTKTGGDTD